MKLVNLQLDDRNIYEAARTTLLAHGHQVRPSKGRFIQIFFGLKYNQPHIPSINSGRYIETAILEEMMDDLYTKSFLPITGGVFSIFSDEYLPRTGVRAGGKGPANNWRNNFNMQKGLGCYAAKSDLNSPSFILEDRRNCRYLLPSSSGKLKDSRCSIPSNQPAYRGESQLKWLSINPNGAGYAVSDLQNTDLFTPYIAPRGVRLPWEAFATAVYHGAPTSMQAHRRLLTGLSPEMFMEDFNLSVAEFEAYFAYTPLPTSNASSPRPSPPAGATSSSPATIPTEPPEPVLGGDISRPPRIHSGWSAEQFVLSFLENAGWEAHDVSRQQVGYDIFAKLGRRVLRVEVKSSLNICVPSMTAREWEQAQRHNDEYILAIIENFDESGSNTISWIKNPANVLTSRMTTTTSYTIARRMWMSNSSSFSNI